jgi:(heptosyl)LPS beta-1,4-glucosyltransferase
VSSIAAVLIVKNEAENLGACLASLSWADEIVVLDSGSTDATEAIARAHGARFFRDADWQGFGRQRQRAQALAQSEWIFMVDADERVTPQLRDSIIQCVAQGPAIGSIARLSWCFGRFIRHSGWYPDRVQRLYPKAQAGYDDTRVHERLRNDSRLPVRVLQGDLLHYTYRDLRQYLEKSAHYAQAWAEQSQERGKRGSLTAGVLHGLGCFLRMYVLKLGVLDGRQGLLLALLSAHATFAKYADLWVRTRTSPP